MSNQSGIISLNDRRNERKIEKEALEIIKKLIPTRKETDEVKIIGAKVLVFTEITDFVDKHFPDEITIN